MESISFGETRDYARRVTALYNLYRARFANGPVEVLMPRHLAGVAQLGHLHELPMRLWPALASTLPPNHPSLSAATFTLAFSALRAPLP